MNVVRDMEDVHDRLEPRYAKVMNRARMPFAELCERRVYYEEHGEGDPVLLVNGLGADHKTWGLQTEAFKQRFRVIVFDNPGVGETEGPAAPTLRSCSPTSPPISCVASASSGRTS